MLYVLFSYLTFYNLYYIYIYIYVRARVCMLSYVCVCVCVCVNLLSWLFIYIYNIKMCYFFKNYIGHYKYEVKGILQA